MPQDFEAGRTRIKGTDPRVRAVTERIGRGSLPMTADSIARQAQFPDDTQARPGHSIYTHEADASNLESIRPSKGGSNFGDPRPQVYGNRANSVDNIPEGRVRIRYQAPDSDIIGRGTGTSTAVSTRGAVPPGNVLSGYSKAGRVFDAGSTTLGLLGLLGTAANFIPGFSERMPRTSWLANGGPIGDVLNEVIANNYGQGGVMDPYRDYQGPRDPTTGAILA
jgi:hypothetical protein